MKIGKLFGETDEMRLLGTLDTVDIEGKTADLAYSDHTAMPGDRANISALSWVRYGTEFEVRMGPETDASGQLLSWQSREGMRFPYIYDIPRK